MSKVTLKVASDERTRAASIQEALTEERGRVAKSIVGIIDRVIPEASAPMVESLRVLKALIEDGNSTNC